MLLGAEALIASSRTALGRPINVVNLYDDAGDRERALEWLERAHELRDIDLPYLRTVLVSKELRADPRFQDLLRRMNFPE